MSEIDKDSFLNVSEFINEEDNLEGEIKVKFNEDEQENNSVINKNEYDYIVRIKENNFLKRENEELKNQINKLLNTQNDLNGKLMISPS